MIEQIRAVLLKLGLDTELNKIDLFIKYIDQLVYWNKAYNLTALKNKNDILINHLYDCLVLIPHLRDQYPQESVKIIDIGSGAGLPGVIIAICQPKWQVVCIDAVGKKVAFIKQVKGLLGLANLKAIHGRVEEIPSLEADLIISRAFASLLDFVKLGENHINASGKYLAMKGHYPEQEIEELNSNTNWQVKNSINLQVPNLEAHRCLLTIDRNTNNQG